MRLSAPRLYLAAAAVLAAAALAAFAVLRPAPVDPATVIGAEEALRASRAGELVIVDVRSPEEWRETGIPERALTVTIHHPRGLPGFADALAAAVDGDRDTPLAMICAEGVRSARARAYLAEHGFTDVKDISVGMNGRAREPGWLDRGLPIEPCEC